MNLEELTPTKSADDTEIDTPPHTITTTQSINPLSFTHGAFHHLPPPPTAAKITYKECMKNHAATIGGHAVDGCGEFMPQPATTTTTNPTSLKCAACGCHRNFHRRDTDSGGGGAITPPFLDIRHPNLPKRFSLSHSPPPPPPPPNIFFTLSKAAAEGDHHHDPATPAAEINPTGRKRFRTKFSQEQKEKMRSFSDKLRWKMIKTDEAKVVDFCHEIGIEKGVLKVWMHNNKTTFCKKELINGGDHSNNNGMINGGRLISFDQNNGGESEERKSDDNDHGVHSSSST